jgi:hypothetical protein
LGRNGGGARAGSLLTLGFSNAAMRSRSEPGLGFGGGGAIRHGDCRLGHAFDVPTLSFAASVCACLDDFCSILGSNQVQMKVRLNVNCALHSSQRL